MFSWKHCFFGGKTIFTFFKILKKPSISSSPPLNVGLPGLNLPYVQMRVPGQGADAWICSWDVAYNEPGAAQYRDRPVSHAHQSVGPLQLARGCCSPLNTLSRPAEIGAPLFHSNGALRLWGPRLYVSVYLRSDDFRRKRLRVVLAFPGWGSIS